MKRILMLLIAVTLTAMSFGQVKKPVNAVKPVASQDSFVVKFTRAYDTSKVRITLYVEDGSVIWTDGYTITEYLVYGQGKSEASGVQLWMDRKKTSIRQQDVLNSVKFDWK